jgi:hypothetical protein
MIEDNTQRQHPDKVADKFENGSIWINRASRDQGLGDAARWKIVGKTPDESGFVLENQQHPGSTIIKTRSDLEHVPKRTITTVPPTTGTMEGETVGNWEYGGKDG